MDEVVSTESNNSLIINRHTTFSKFSRMASMLVKMPQGNIIASLTNHTPKEMFCDRYFNWSGTPSPYPPTIPAGDATKFMQFSSKGAVVYHGQNEARNPTTWVLAWDAPKTAIPGARNKVYVTCGSKSMIDKMSEGQILKKLSEASDKSSAIDQMTNTTVKANIWTPNEPIDVSIFATFRSTH